MRAICPKTPLPLTLACTYGKADPFCQTMFAMWADIANNPNQRWILWGGRTELPDGVQQELARILRSVLEARS